ncbi:1-acyl-sn-glycerol-3-phosphate acyltransferase [Nocardia terpenica]|uniref:NAD-dependent epimerase/dehydratase family protein n=1 Tax=Nocardia terpenica TaxID=455432 RepID=A0A6G9Z9D0_9NOCA|nr:1-acyl-sn-glycerol-3-phosphate acyltransferase [Nocardia terpenica]QIS21623.1 NAD-dependent epimerase/dehydratase family protein [Nocardia terpenica]
MESEPNRRAPGTVEDLSVLVVGEGALAAAVCERLSGTGRLVRAAHTDDGAVGVVTRRERRCGGPEVVTQETRYPSWPLLLADAAIAAVVFILPHAERESSCSGGVLGAMRLMSACRKSAAVRRLVVVADAAVYPCGPAAPSVIDENVSLSTASAYARNLAEIERLVLRCARSQFDPHAVVLRLAPVVGPGADNTLARLLTADIPWKPMGYDARLQLLHIDDAAAAVAAALTTTAAGVFNIAAPGVVTLGQAARRRGLLPVALPHTVLPQVAELAGIGRFTDGDIALLRFGRFLDTSRARTQLGFAPAYPTLAALDDHLRCHPPTPGAGPAVLEVLAGSAPPQRIADRLSASLGLPNVAEVAGRVAGAAVKSSGVGTVLGQAGRIAGAAARLTGLPGPARLAETAGGGARIAAELTGLSRVGDLAAQANRLAGALTAQLRQERRIDEYGYDAEFMDLCAKYLMGPFLENYLRLETVGLENISDAGRAVVVANHSGALPLDMVALGYATRYRHPARRTARVMGGDLVSCFPYVGDLLHRWGCVSACPEEADRLLAAGEIVVVCPEGYKGLGKPYAQRYQLQRFGRGGFVKAALRSGAPLIPAAVFGAEELYPMISQARPLAKLFGLPYLPITATFPWFGPLGLIPRRSRLIIEFGEPIPTAQFGPDAADDADLVLDLSHRIRVWIQDRLDARLAAADRN